jgi:hypothetical protein
MDMRRDLHRKARGGSVPEIFDDQPPLTAYKRRRPKGAENNPFISTGVLTAALALLTSPNRTPLFPLELQTGRFLQENWLTKHNC